MNSKKAIELNKEVWDSLDKHKFPDHADAVLIGNEALKWIILCRVTSPGTVPELLHGETKE